MHWGDVELPLVAVLNLNAFMLLSQYLFSVHPLSLPLRDAFTGIFNYLRQLELVARPADYQDSRPLEARMCGCRVAVGRSKGKGLRLR